jgi:xylulokinase
MYLLGLDIGTTGVKAVLIDPQGRVLASGADTYPLHTPQPLWAEQNPHDWWRATCNAIQQIVRESGIPPSQIRGVGLSGQMHGSVFLDEQNRIICPALLWCDQRTAEECAWITERVGQEKVLETTLNPVLTGFQAGKIIWLRRHEPANYARVRHVLLPKDYIRFMLTGEYATEVSDASGTALFEVPKRDWAYDMLDTLELPREWFPKVYESPEITGRVHAQAAAATGLAEGTPVVGGAGDQAAGAVGTGIVQEGRVAVSVGTSGVVFAHLDQPRVDHPLPHAHLLPRRARLLACDGRDADGGWCAAVVSRDLRARCVLRRAGTRSRVGSRRGGGATVRAVPVGRAHPLSRPEGARGFRRRHTGASACPLHPRRAGRGHLRLARLV